MYDLIIKNALVADGTNSPMFKSDIAVKDGKIISVSDTISDETKKIIDASGYVVCPGFIDAHGHSDFTLFVNNRGESKIRQGITTEVTGNCGFTAGPITEEHEDDLVHYLANTIVLSDELRSKWKWKSQNEFLEFCARDGLSFNVVPLVGQGMIHVGVMGFDDRHPTDAEYTKMKNMLKKELDAGFFGMSMAFEYEPGNYMKPEEIFEMCKVLKQYDAIYTIHMQNEGMNLTDCVKYAIEICRKSGCRVEISHLKARYIANWGKTKEAIKLIEDAKKEGLDIAFDVYPYAAYGSGLIDLIPPWVKKDGPRIMCERLKDNELRKKALSDMETGLDGWDSIMKGDGWDKCVQIASLKTQANKKYEGMVIHDIAKDRGITSYEAVVELMVEEDASIKCIWFAMNEDELQSIMKHPDAIFGTDGRACATYGELSKGAVHPRYYATYPRIMGHYVREEGIMTLEEAIYKSTYAVAKRFGIDRRGAVKEGFFADLVVFSPEKIRETNSFKNPHSYPEGISHVIVNGEIVIEHGKHLGNLPGIILRKE